MQYCEKDVILAWKRLSLVRLSRMPSPPPLLLRFAAIPTCC